MEVDNITEVSEGCPDAVLLAQLKLLTLNLMGEMQLDTTFIE